MSWLQPDGYDQRLFDALLAEAPGGRVWDQPFGRLCLALAPALRIEPRLLRNARLRYLPRSDASLEQQFWFSRTVHARGARAVTMRPGLARLLVDHLDSPEHAGVGITLAQVCAFVTEHSTDWGELDRLEQGLRWAARENNEHHIDHALRELLRRVNATESARDKAELARWVKGALTEVSGALGERPEGSWLVQFAGATLGDASGVLAGRGTARDPMPIWLNRLLPQSSSHSLSLRLGHTANGAVLECLDSKTEPSTELPCLVLSTPAPTPVCIEFEDGNPAEPRWVALFAGCRIPLGQGKARLILRTLDGRRFRLSSTGNTTPNKTDHSPEPDTSTVLVHIPADATLAKRVAAWLADQGIAVRLLEQAHAESVSVPSASSETPPTRLLRLWSHASARLWSEFDGTTPVPTLLLRADATAGPPPGAATFRLLDIQGWDRRDEEQGHQAAEALRAWLADPSPPGPASSEDEISHMLAELDNPATAPPRRLAIGDRLAELGDPRPGVGVREFDVPVELSPQVSALLAELENPDTDPPRRLAIGDELAELGDPRLGVGLDDRGLPEIDWVEIPAGAFRFQGEQTIELPRYFLSRYPVTNAQYQSFIDAGGYQDERWWADLAKPEEGKSTWPQPNRPRTNVDRYEATAFCRWLSAQLGVEIRLPTEVEWERAAAGAEGREYPWGNSFLSSMANLDETEHHEGPWYLGQTIAVGVYPHGASVEGVLDLSGNVWEWCANSFDSPFEPYAGDSSRNRVEWARRGGSWLHSPTNARTMNRGKQMWHAGHKFLGFRLLRKIPLSG